MDDDFNLFVDKVLDQAARRQSGENVVPVSFRDICMTVDPNAPPTWIEMAMDRIRKLGLGKFSGSKDPNLAAARYLRLNGDGLAHVHAFRAQQRAETLPWFRKVSAAQGSVMIAALALAAYLLVEILKS